MTAPESRLPPVNHTPGWVRTGTLAIQIAQRTANSANAIATRSPHQPAVLSVATAPTTGQTRKKAPATIHIALSPGWLSSIHAAAMAPPMGATAMTRAS